jgi:hypothetical protein
MRRLRLFSSFDYGGWQVDMPHGATSYTIYSSPSGLSLHTSELRLGTGTGTRFRERTPVDGRTDWVYVYVVI